MPTIRLRQLVLVCAGLCFVWTCSCWARIHSTSGAQIPTYSESVLYSFCAATGCADGAMPSYGNLILGSDGNLYGVTASGGNSAAQCGTYGCGTVFRLSPTGVFATLYAFCNEPNCSDGLFPSSLIEGSDGNFYGVTEQGGTNTYQACGGGSGCGAGTVFRLTPAGILTTLYSFCNQADCTDGANPNAPPLQASDGNFYGTTLSGGLSGCDGYGCGTVYKITSSGTLTTLYRFCSTANCADGVGPFAALVEGPDGDFYGTTSGQYAGSSVGASDPGQTAFKITPTGTLTSLYTFCSQSNCTDGDGPTSTLLLASDGYFYGTTGVGGADSSGCNGYGCGTVFKISSSGAFSTVYSFCDAADCTLGNQPQAGLIQASDGSFYGVALANANLGPGGTVYKVNSSGNASLVYSFCSLSNNQASCIDGRAPNTLPIQAADGNLYGMTGLGGFNGSSTPPCQNTPGNSPNLGGCGTVFKISSSPASTSATTAPVQMSLSQSAIDLGSSVTLKWAVSNAFSLTTQQCNAFVQGGVSGAGVWTGIQSGTLSGGLYSGEATLTPAAGGTYTYALTCGGIESGFVTLTVGAPAALSITTTTLPNGTEGQSYSTILAATGGVAPYTWSITSGSLPAGLSLNASTGDISGTPSEPGTANFVVQVADSEGTPTTATAGLAITIPTPICVVAPDANSTTVNVAAPGQSATALLTVSNFSSNSISFSCSGLPSGASCSFSNLTGSGNSGTVTLTVKTTAPSVGATGQAVRLAGFSLPALLVIAALSQKKRRDLYLFALVLMMGFVLNGCGGGGSNTGGGAGGSPGTPTGTATLTVKAVSGSQSAQTNLTLSVQ
jgi:uncharacterized repeat protein (TIGR03803 family)